MVRYNLSFAGAGRVAAALCHEMYRCGHKINQIVSETKERGLLLANQCEADWSSELLFTESSDIIIVAVPDHRLEEVLSKIKCHPGTLVVHTAGSFGMDVFPQSISRRGVFYPLQTFTHDRAIDFGDLPVMIEAGTEDSLELLKNLAGSIGGKAYIIDAKQRKELHLAAVFVCNFVNHLLTIGKEIVSKTDLPFSVLEPLINETIQKALEKGPEYSQTGPAIRNDQNTIKKHMDLLSFSPDMQDIYKTMTSSIMKQYKIQIHD